MRIPIREQLGLLVLLCCLIALMVLSVATWTRNHGFIIDIRLSALSLVASTRAARISASLFLYQMTVHSIATRLMIQDALKRYNEGNTTEENWDKTFEDLESAIAGGEMAVALQTIIFPKNNTSNGNPNGLVNSTSQGNLRRMQLPMTFANGSDVYLGDPGLGYPPSLYPNLTHPSEATEDDNDDEPSTFFNGQELWPNTTLILGPYPVNESFFLMSMTVAVRNSTTPSDVLGWMTVVLDASLIYDAIVSPEGLQQTGQILIVTPTNAENLFRPAVELTDPTSSGDKQVRYAFPPQSNSNLSNRHASRALQRGDPNLSFPMRDYPAVVDAWTKDNEAINNAGAIISTRDEDNARISVGYAAVSTSLVDWILLFEQSYDEVMAPVHRLRDIVLACVFGTTGVIMILLFPVAHFAVRPIRHLREATSKTSTPILPDHAERSSSESRQLDRSGTGDEETVTRMAMGKKEGFLTTVSRWKHGAHSPVRAGLRERGGQTGFKIPGKVPERQPWIKDELSDLTSTFNEMSDELVLHYARLEERVKERTAELEESKKAAESANASKTLFIANISHELKTPLNGILGMCAVCMQEEDIRKIRQSLSIIYKSGDLLLHLLTDLLTFSKNSIGQQLTIDTGEFKLLDVSTQVASIFERQAKEGEIDLQVEFLGTCDALGNFSDDSGPKLYGPAGTGRVKDMWLWGDKNRILQVLINLVSNSLKFTPATGSVHVRINCIGLAAEGQTDPRDSSRRPSIRSKQSRKSRSSWNRRGRDSDGSLPTSAVSLDNCAEKMDLSRTNTREINVVVAGEPKPLPQVAVRQRSPSPAPLNTKVLMFEFAITDTGPGIPEEQMSRIFEPFVQGDLGLSKKYAGTGLGLSICAQLASLMGGNITLQSTVGVGSTFTVKLPLRYVSGRRASTSSSPARIGNASPSPSPRPSTSRRPSLVSKPGSEKQVLSQNLGGSVGGNAGVAGGGSVGSSVDSSIDGRRSGRKAIAPASKNDGSGNDTADQPAAAPLQDLPRIVGFSQPFIAGGDVISPASRSIEAAQVQSPKLSEIKRAENKAAKKGEKVRVLVAEDNKVNQEVVTRMLKLESVYDVTIAKDGQEALDLVCESMESNATRFDLIFMDVQMPNLDGIQSTKLIRQKGFSAPIVALTAFSEESNIKDCYDSGMDFFLPKPIRRKELKNVLVKYCPPTIHEHEHEDEHEQECRRRRQNEKERGKGWERGEKREKEEQEAKKTEDNKVKEGKDRSEKQEEDHEQKHEGKQESNHEDGIK